MVPAHRASRSRQGCGILSVPDSAAFRQGAFWFSILLIVGVSLWSLLSTQRLVASAERVDRTQSALLQLEGVLSGLQDAESGARGFAMTGESAYLQPLRNAESRVSEHVRLLKELAGKDAGQRQRIARIEALAQRRLAFAERVISARRTTSEPLDGNILGPGKAAMDAARREIERMAESERALYRVRENAVRDQALRANMALIGGIIASLAVLIALFILANRQAARRIRAEEALQRLNSELERRVEERTVEVRRTKELLDAVIENIPDMVFLKDTADDHRFLLINRAGEELLGRGREEIIGQRDQNLVPDEQAEAFLAADRAVISSGRIKVAPSERISTPRGLRLLETRRIPIFDEEGAARFLLGISRDVTDQRSLESQLRQSQRMEAVGQLTGGIAHDFNNLLAILLGNAELLQERLASDPESTELVEEILGASDRGGDLVRRLLAFARKQHLDAEPVDLNQRLPEIVGLLRRSLGERVRIQTAPAEALWPALIDPTQVDDAILNLAINARDAMPNGGMLTIETANVRLDEAYASQHVEVSAGDYVMLAVSDSGSGMPPEVVARAFEPFFTTKEMERGTGLGLSQVYGWVKQSGGHVKIYSEVGHGTTVKLYLPRAADEAAEAAAARAEETAPTGTETVLVVEDNPGVRRMVVRQLTELGYRTSEASDASEALATIDSDAPIDLLFSDVVMPGEMTGYDLVNVAVQRRPGLRVLLTSGYTEVAARSGNGSRQAGALLSKPYRKVELARAVREALEETGD